ncbi:transposase family protein [Streptomyces sp. IB201691-2A2]|nr:transposase family protein [Streptomyces sp. IB201691-2A2]
MPDPRDPRGVRHALVGVLASATNIAAALRHSARNTDRPLALLGLK